MMSIKLKTFFLHSEIYLVLFFNLNIKIFNISQMKKRRDIIFENPYYNLEIFFVFPSAALLFSTLQKTEKWLCFVNKTTNGNASIKFIFSRHFMNFDMFTCLSLPLFFFVFLFPTSFDIARLMIARPRVHTARAIAAAIESVICNFTKYLHRSM